MPAESNTLTLQAAGRIPATGDNCAIAIRRLDAGTRIEHGGTFYQLTWTVLEGHRFVVAPIPAGESLTSWGLPFGRALHALAPGDYVCNTTMIEALQARHVDFPVPAEANFTDFFQSYSLDERVFTPAAQVPPCENSRTFLGYARRGGRGVGTRNHLVVLGTSSLTGSFARALAAKFKDAARLPNVDGVVAVAHTEGGESGQPNNLEFTLRTLAGFLVNPNVGAVLAVDYGHEPVNNDVLRDWMRAHDYPLTSVPHHFFRLGKSFANDLGQAAEIVHDLLRALGSVARTPQPLRHLKIGLQCGGSDAFSGVSGNPLVGLIAREIIRHGGSANLAETDELHGAEPYVLAKVRDLATARQFLHALDAFEERLGWHGVSGQSNPSGGNIFRGLYNIAIKSIGAARKKDPAVRLDYVIGFGELMHEPGFCFMDSPGNDLESIAGQVAAGCNLILFSTGNGSVTNHPFVPTIKVMTNTPRFELLSRDMDFNAGRYLDGEPLELLGEEAFDHTVNVASGQRSIGEKAGHSQAQLWREWRQTSNQALATLANRPVPAGLPVKLRASEPASAVIVASLAEFFRTNLSRRVPNRRLIIPTSLCAGQVGRLIADQLNAAAEPGASVYVALPHTEGCGVSGEAIDILERTLAGYAVHPLAERTLLLEHGCEKTHNHVLRNFLTAHGFDLSHLGFASIQLDGGIDKVTDKVAKWFAQAPLTAGQGSGRIKCPAAPPLCLGLVACGNVPEPIAAAFALIARSVVIAGGSVVLPQKSPLLAAPAFARDLFEALPAPTVPHGGILPAAGLHVMEASGGHLVESLTGLGATGVELFLIYAGNIVAQGHPFVPTVQVSDTAASAELDLHLDEPDATSAAHSVTQLIARVLAGTYRPRAQAAGNVDFQMTRGLLGVST